MVEQENNQPESMEDILSSIRETVEEEAAAVSSDAEASADDADIDAMMAEQSAPEEESTTEEPVAEEPADDALDLSAMLEEDDEPQEAAEAAATTEPVANHNVEEVIDIETFNSTGKETTAPEVKAENARELYRGGEVDPEIMAQTNEVEQPPAEEEAVEAKPTEEIAESAEETMAEPAVEAETTEVEAVATAATEVLTKNVQVSPDAVQLPTTPGADGLQVTFPVEVLATALRPLVKDWVAQNLPDVVERLVKEELSKLADQ